MGQVVTDKYLATALRQAAKRLDQQRIEIENLRGQTLPLADKLSVHDFIPLLRKADSNEQIKIVVDAIDGIHRTDPTLIVDDDWVLLTRVISECKN